MIISIFFVIIIVAHTAIRIVVALFTADDIDLHLLHEASKFFGGINIGLLFSNLLEIKRFLLHLLNLLIVLETAFPLPLTRLVDLVGGRPSLLSSEQTWDVLNLAIISFLFLAELDTFSLGFGIDYLLDWRFVSIEGGPPRGLAGTDD
jgi:hypothetical protein